MTVGAQVKQTLSSLKGVQSTLQTFAINAEAPEAKRAFHEAMLLTEEVISDLKKRVSELEREEPEYHGF
jgi:signal transduction histidine kinase